jgi:hypothetical protein
MPTNVVHTLNQPRSCKRPTVPGPWPLIWVAARAPPNRRGL